MEHEDFIKNKKYHAYVKGGLALRYLQDGVRDFVKDVSEKQHEQIKMAVGLTPENTCNNCQIKTLKPHSPIEGSKPGKYNCPKTRPKCNCVRKENTLSECPKNICNVFVEAIIESEVNGEPNWKNTNILSQWPNNSWEIQKCFIKSPGYDKTTSADETDAAGLLILMAHNKFFQNYMEVIPDKKITDWRGALFHGNMELEDEQLTSAIEEIKTILQDEKCLKNMECSKRAIRNVEKLQTENFYMSKEDEKNVSRDALAFFQQNFDTHEEQIKSLAQRVSKVEKERKECRKSIEIQKEHLKKIESRKGMKTATSSGTNIVHVSSVENLQVGSNNKMYVGEQDGLASIPPNTPSYADALRKNTGTSSETNIVHVASARKLQVGSNNVMHVRNNKKDQKSSTNDPSSDSALEALAPKDPNARPGSTNSHRR